MTDPVNRLGVVVPVELATLYELHPLVRHCLDYAASVGMTREQALVHTLQILAADHERACNHAVACAARSLPREVFWDLTRRYPLLVDVFRAAYRVTHGGWTIQNPTDAKLSALHGVVLDLLAVDQRWATRIAEGEKS